MNRGVMTGAILVVILAAGYAVIRSTRGGGSPSPSDITRAPLSKRVRVEVLNGGRTPGAARDATILLRHAGLDVVSYGDAGAAFAAPERAQVLVRRGDTTGAGRVREALGPVDIVDAPDPSRLVELTVILGRVYPARPVVH